MMILKFVLAMIPIIWLICALSVLKMPGHIACAIALGLTMVLAVGCWHLPVISVGSAVVEGVLNALWPICLVIVAALFTYNLSVKTGAMEEIKSMLASVSTDKRVLALLIAWGFGNFMEGMAGFGTAVAIPSSMLVAIGLHPIQTVLACLVVNSTPTCFGSVGVPVVTLSSITGIDALSLASSASIMQLLLVFLSPFIMVAIAGGGLKALKGVFATTFVAALSFCLPWFIAANHIGPELPDIIGAIISMVCIIFAAKIFNKNPDPEYRIQLAGDEKKKALSLSDGMKAWSPFVLIFVLLMLTSTLCPPIHDLIAGIKTSLIVYVGENPNTLSFSWINTPGVMIFIAAIIGGFIQKASPKMMVCVLGETLKKYWRTILTICCVMSIGKIMSYSGMIADIAKLLVVVAGSFYPAIAPLIGAIGGFVTGSGTSTCVLFGGLQSQTAASLGLSESWIAGANVVGAGIGKMICPQSIAIGAGAIDMVGSESKILSAVFKYFLLYAVLAGVFCFIGAML